jgi:hypothetical protein
MAGEINTTNTLVQNSSGVIVGQGAFTHTYGGTPIEISNKSYGDNVTYLNGELATKQHVFSGEFVYNNDPQFRTTRASTFSGTHLSDSLGAGEAAKTTLTFSSSGAVTIVPAADA